MGHPRYALYDNFRALLLFLVILGHCCELFYTGTAVKLYRIIYTFHVPALLFLSGRFAAFDRRRFFRGLLLPYLIFQALYLCFDAAVLHTSVFRLQFTKPYWILWYLLALLVYFLLLQLLPERSRKNAVLVVGLSVVLSVLAGFDRTLSYFLALSRIVVFAPFFFLGYYAPQLRLPPRYLSLALGLAVACFGVAFFRKIDVRLFWGSCSYALCRETWGDRLLLLAVSAGWILFFLNLLPRRRLPVLTALGRGTLLVYLLHGFIIRLAKQHHWFRFSPSKNLLLAVGLSAALLLLLGSPPVTKLFRKAFA